MVVWTSFFFSFLCLCGWLSSDGGADFNKGCDCLQSEATRDEQRRATFSYGENFVKRKSLGFLRATLYRDRVRLKKCGTRLEKWNP